MDNAKNFLITSTYPTDKIVWVHEGSVTLDQYGAFDVIIPHGLTATPFCSGIWTVDEWQTQYNTSTATHLGQMYSRFSQISSDLSDVEFSGYCANDDGSAMSGSTVKYRLWGFFNEATTQTTYAETTASVSQNNFIKNTGFGYPKLFAEGFADATTGTKTVYHGLGFIPFVELWQNLGGKWFQVDYIDFTATGTTWTVHNTPIELSFNGDGYTQYEYYYRIYADE